jgi:outer membrane protein
MKRKVLLVIMTMLMPTLVISAQTKEWSLEDCIRYALQNNIQLKQQEITTEYKNSTLQLSKLSVLPTLNGYASQDFNYGRHQVIDDVTGIPTYKTTNSSYFNYGASSGITLFAGLTNYNTIKKNQFSLLASQQDIEALKDNISLNIAVAYLQVLLDKELVIATSAQVDLTTQQIDRTQKLVDAGSVAKGDLLDIQAQAASEDLQLTNLQNNLNIAYLNLAQMLELDSTENFNIVVPDIEINQVAIDGDPRSIYQIAEKDRPEILSAEYSLKASESGLAVAKGGRSPSLSMSGSYGSYSQNTDYFKASFADELKNNYTYGFGFTLNVPIFNGWAVNKNIQNAKLGIHYSEYTLEATKKTLYKDIAQAFADANGALRKYYSSKKAVESMEEAFRYSEQKFSVGLVNAIDYNQAKTKLLNAESEMAQAKYEYVFKTKVLDFYKGLPLTLEQIGVISK